MTIEDLHEVFDGTPCFGSSLSSYIQEIRGDMLNFSIENGNSVGQIIFHMLHWRSFVINKTETALGISKSISIDETNAVDWPKNTFQASDKNILIRQLRDTQKQLIQVLKKATDDLLSQKVDGRDYNFEHMLKGIIHHDIYHLGQLYLLVSLAKNQQE